MSDYLQLDSTTKKKSNLFNLPPNIPKDMIQLTSVSKIQKKRNDFTWLTELHYCCHTQQIYPRLKKAHDIIIQNKWAGAKQLTN